MYHLNLSEFSQEEFLRDYWQKKPVVIKQGFIDFKDPISADELAGLALEEQVQSRLVYKKEETWQAEFGPFESYDHLGEKDWSLVIQALDNWSEDAAKIIEPFRFIPHWRLDDLMTSFATAGGSVGPHIDLYDTFICQGSGNRNWRVGDKGEHRQYAAHASLLHVEPFTAIIDVELNAGDILYIPPGFPHEGLSLNNSMSFSVGFRTNSTVSLLSAFADHLIDNEQGGELIEDPHRKATKHSGAIDGDDYQLIKNQLQQLLDNDDLFRNFTGSYLSQAKHELDLAEIDEALAPEDISEILTSNNLMRIGGLRSFYFTETIDSGICYIDGNEVIFPAEIAAVIKLLCDQVCVTVNELSIWRQNTAFIVFISEQITAGYWYFSE
ncbi:MAG: 50S ribosomal protein L16 3-hydroxylase [Alteromonadaceae bacterium]|jgi:50S ribosomal protein L16 3-hydroxylase